LTHLSKGQTSFLQQSSEVWHFFALGTQIGIESVGLADGDRDTAGKAVGGRYTDTGKADGDTDTDTDGIEVIVGIPDGFDDVGAAVSELVF
jgi:hypothetical protein